MYFNDRHRIGRIFSATLLAVVLTCEADAFYSSDNNESEFFLFPPQYSVFAFEENRNFVLYDNFRHRAEKYHQKSVIFPATEQFVPMDTIDFDFPVYNVLHDRIVTNHDTTNFLYANLRLEMLKEEYESVQKRARVLLLGIEDPFDLSTDSERSKEGNSRKDNPDRDDESVQEKLSRLRKKSKSASRHTWQLKSAESEMVVVGNLVLDPDADHKKGSITEEKKNREKDAKRQLTYSWHGKRLAERKPEKNPLPLVFKIPTDVARYLMSNKVEAAVYGVVLMLLIVIVSSLRPRDDE